LAQDGWDVHKMIITCNICHMAKSHLHQGLCNSLTLNYVYVFN